MTPLSAAVVFTRVHHRVVSSASHIVATMDNPYAGVKIRRALGPMALKIACGPSELTLGGPAGPQGPQISRRH